MDQLTHREISMAHTIDVTETKRAHMKRMLTGNRPLLADALDAVRAGNTTVADEFIDRFLSALDKEIEYQKAR